MLETREPGGAPGAELLRGLLLGEAVAFIPLAEAMLHSAARAEHVARAIRPALDAGQMVVCDRYADSTLAYQGYGQGVSRTAIDTLTGLIGLMPDLTLILDVPVDTALTRLHARGGGGDRYERLGADFFAKVNAGFRDIAARAPGRCVLIPAEAAPDAVQARILAAVRERLGLPAGAAR